MEKSNFKVAIAVSASVQEGGSRGKLWKRSCHFAVVPGGASVEGGKPKELLQLPLCGRFGPLCHYLDPCHLPLLKDKDDEAQRGHMVFTCFGLVLQ